MKGKQVLVTGASGGIGRALVEELHAEQASPWVHYRSQGKAAVDLCDQLGLGVDKAVSADLRREQDVDELFAKIARGAEPNALSGLVVNAGIWEETVAPIRDMSFGQWKNTMATNLESAFLCCRAFLRQLDPGVPAPAIVFIGSTAGLYGEEGHADYSASKAAMRGLMLSLKNEIVRLHPRGRVNLVNPGWVATPMAEEALKDEALVRRVTSTMALRKVASPEDVARSVVFMLSDRLAGHVSGEAITVAGGMEGRLLHRD